MFKVRFCVNLMEKCLYSPQYRLRKTLPISIGQIGNISSEIRSELDVESQRSRFKDVGGVHSVEESRLANCRETEQEFIVRIKNNPDNFGEPLEEEREDEGDSLEEKHFTERPNQQKRLRTKGYADIIKRYIHQRKIKEAIDVLEVRMLKEDKVKPENYIYNLLLGACGRVGYTKKAFMLYNDMKKRGLKVHAGAYTALFNACANSPWPTTDGLTRANHLYSIMIERGDQPNDTNYNAMIKAFGRCGDLKMAFSLVDEMCVKGFLVKDDTINFLLQACISDHDTGFRHSLLVWRKLIEKNITPSIYTFNLLLRSIRDCGLGDLDATREVIQRFVGKENVLELLHTVSNDLLPSGLKNTTEKALLEDQQLSPVNTVENVDIRPNLLAVKPNLGSILSLSEITKPEDRLLLVGGCRGFLETMMDHKCTPDIKTFTQLLDCIPGTLAAEKGLLSFMKKINVKPDIDFYNMLIKKKSMRFDYEEAREVLTSMKQMKMRPNLITYGVLSLGCKSKEEAVDLLSQMKNSGYTLNAAILGAMLKQACFQMKFDYVFEVMEMCLKENVPVNKKFIEHLDGFKEKLKAKRDAKVLNKTELKLFGIFKARLKNWLTEVQMDESEEAHPWQQFRQTYPEDVGFKVKDGARFKARHQSQFRVKTSTRKRW